MGDHASRGEAPAAARPGPSEEPKGAPDPYALLRSRSYVGLLVLAAVVGVPVAFVAYFFLAFVSQAQHLVFVGLPQALGFASAPLWWPVLPLMLSGLVVGLTLRYLHGTGGHKPAEGFKAGGPTDPRDLPGIFVAAAATLCLGAVLGPEAPLIAIGSGLGVLAVRLAKRDAPQAAVGVIAGAGSFAAISTLLGSPITGAFLLMEAAGLAGTMMGVVLVPGLLAAGVGALIFVGLDNWTGLGSFSLAIPSVPPAVTPTIATMAWALVLGAAAAPIGWVIRSGALSLRPLVHRSRVPVTAALGLLVGLIAMTYQLISGHSFTQVLFSGEDALPDLVANATDYSVATLILLGVCKAAAYSLSLSAFRGGPVFPALLIGGALGIAAAGLPGMDLASSIAVGIGAMCTTMLRLPLTSTLLAVVLLGADGVVVTPPTIVAVVVAFVVTGVLPEPRGSEPVTVPA